MYLWLRSLFALVYTRLSDPDTITMLGHKRYLKVYFAVHVALYQTTKRLYSRDTTDILARSIELVVCGFDGIVDELGPVAAIEFLTRTELVLANQQLPSNISLPPAQQIFFERLARLVQDTHDSPVFLEIMRRNVRALTAEHLETPADSLIDLSPDYPSAGIHCIFDLLVELQEWEFSEFESRLIRTALDLGSVILRILDDTLDVLYLRLGWLDYDEIESRNLLKRHARSRAGLRDSLRLAITTVESLLTAMYGYLHQLSSTRYQALLTSMCQSLTLYPRYVLPLVRRLSL